MAEKSFWPYLGNDCTIDVGPEKEELSQSWGSVINILKLFVLTV